MDGYDTYMEMERNPNVGTDSAAAADAEEDASCFSTVLTVLGALFAFLTIVINLADVATDIVVAVQFYREDHIVWFALVVTFLCLAHIVYVIVGAEVMTNSPGWGSWQDVPRPLRYLIMLPIAQLLPLINFIMETRRGDVVRHYGGDLPVTVPVDAGASLAAREEIEAARRSRILQRRMYRAMTEHLEKFGLFYVESAVEAAPQAIIQLLAITFLDEASPAQLVSLCLSLFSITTKFVVVSRSYDARVMIFKFALAAHDVFSTFYLFSTIVAVETHKDTDFFGLRVSWLGYIWLWKIIGEAIIAFLNATGFAIFTLIHDSADWTQKLSFVLAYIGGLIFSLPIALLFETAKLSYGILGLATTEPGDFAWPVMVTFLAFFDGDDSDNSRLRHCVVSLVDRQEEAHAQSFVRAAPPGAVRRAVRRGRVGKHVDSTFYHQYGETVLRARREALDTSKPFTLWTLNYCFGFRDAQIDCSSVRPAERFLMTLVVFNSSATFLAQGFSFLYPFINAGLQHANHNILQATCFYATLTALAVALFFLPNAYRYLRMNVCFKGLYYHLYPPLLTATEIIGDYHTPPHIEVLQLTTPVSVLPAEVTMSVARFLTPEDIGLGHLSVAECNALKRQIADSQNAARLNDVDDDDGDDGIAWIARDDAAYPRQPSMILRGDGDAPVDDDAVNGSFDADDGAERAHAVAATTRSESSTEPFPREDS